MATYNQQWPRSGWVLEGRQGRRGRRPEDEFLTTLYQVLLVLVVVACCLAGSASDLTDLSLLNHGKGEVTPTDPYVLEGGKLELNCTIKLDKYKGNATSEDIYFRAGTKVIPAQYVTVLNPLTARMIVPNISEVALRTKPFSCYVGTDENKVLMGKQFVHIAKPLIKPVIKECVIENWEVMRCTWLPEKQDTSLQKTGVALFWSNGTKFLEKNHSKCPIHEKDSNVCKWPLKIDDMWLYAQGMTVIVVALSRSEPAPGTNRSMLDLEEQSDPHFINATLIVKPNPVALNILNQALSNVVIQWRPPVDDHALILEVKYRSQWDKPGHWQTVTFLENHGNQMRLKDPTPYTNYTISVKCKPAVGGLWSDASTKTFPTPPDVPSKNPEVLVGSYESHKTRSNNRSVLIHWKPLERQFRNGPELNYNVHLMSDGDCLIKPNGILSPVSKIVPHNDHITYLNVTAHQSCSFNFSIQSENLLGFTQQQPKIVTVPAMNSQYSLVEGMVMDAYDNRHVEVRWRVNNLQGVHVTSHTVYWCKSSYSNFMCQDPLSWQEVPMPQSSFNITLKDNASYTQYSFAVSQTSANSISSGMVWSGCAYDKREKSTPPEKVNVSTSEGPESILVVWPPHNCKQKTGYILTYTIFYCVTAGANQNCTGEVSQVKVPGESTSHILENLESPQFYRVTIESESLAGRSVRHSIPVYIQTRANWATSGVIAAITISVIIVLILFIAGLTALVCNFRKCHTWFTGLRIDLPEKMSNGGVMRGTSTSSSQPLRLHSYGDLDHHNHHSQQQQQQHLFYNQQLSIESWSADSGNGSLSHDTGSTLPRRHSLSLSEGSEADDVFNNTMNTTDGAVDVSSLDGAKDGDPKNHQQQVTTYQVDKNRHPMNAEHANKNGYVKMGDNGVVFSKNSVPSLPKVVEEE